MNQDVRPSDDPANSPQVCILVLGMDRSGSSALTRVLIQLGCALPGDSPGASPGGPDRHWQSLGAIEINDALLGSMGLRWDDMLELPSGWLQRPETDVARQRIRAFVDREFPREKLSVLNDPRLRRLAPVWIEVLAQAGIDARIVISLQHPAEVAHFPARRAASITEQERESQIASLKQSISDSGAYIGRLNQELYERSQLMVSQELQIASLTKAVADGERAVNELLDTRSWKITRPLRVISTLVTRGLRQPMRANRARRLAGDIGRSAENESPASLDASVAASESLFAPQQDSDFDEEFYLLQYPDIGRSGVDPYRHYIENGIAEGRQGARPKLQIRVGGKAFDPSKETVMVVSHEASRTGAPVLSFNIAQGLQDKFNVISLLMGEGPLVDAFRKESSLLVGPMALRGAPLRAKLVIDQLLELHPIKFAIVNSIEARAVLEPLARHSIPTVSLIHEFAAYTRPRQAFCDAVFWADATVFSTAITLENAVSEFPELANRPFGILPQGRCGVPDEAMDAAAREMEEARVLHAMRPRGQLDDKVVVLGAGFVQQRKGVDLFIKCAARVLRTEEGKRCRFVWIGKGYDPENDMGYSVYLADQLRRSGLERQVIIMDETSCIETAYKAADILLLSSRLDPLPNVAIEAMAHGLPVVCFERTTGIANFLVEADLSDHCVSGYLDTADMAEKVLALAMSSATRRDVGERVRRLVAERFDMQTYVAQLQEAATAAAERLAGKKGDVREIIESGVFRPDYFLLPEHGEQPLEEVLEFDYLRSWATGLRRRKLFPGFHPGMYLEQGGGSGSRVDPTVAFLRAGRPEGAWCSQVISSAELASNLMPETRVALHLHVYYPELLPEILARLALNSIRPDLFVSVPNANVSARVEKILEAYTGTVVVVQVVPNRGRDIAPLLTVFGPELMDSYDIVGHFHTKKSADLKDAKVGEQWQLFLLENLLGGKSKMADIILGRMAADPSIGIVFPDDPYVVGWGRNLPFAEALGGALGLGEFPEHFLFPIGTMFWARTAAIRPLVDLRLEWNDYPPEPLPNDGTVLHALERVLPFVVASQGARSVLTNVVGVTR